MKNLLKLKGRYSRGFFIDDKHFISVRKPLSAECDKLEIYRDGVHVYSVKQLKIKF